MCQVNQLTVPAKKEVEWEEEVEEEEGVKKEEEEEEEEENESAISYLAVSGLT